MTTKELIKALRDESNCNVLDYIGEAADRLEELAAELEAERHRHDRYVDFELAQSAELAKVKAERDALLEIAKDGGCDTCMHEQVPHDDQPCCGCHGTGGHADNWEWRGVMPNE